MTYLCKHKYSKQKLLQICWVCVRIVNDLRMNKERAPAQMRITHLFRALEFKCLMKMILRSVMDDE